MKVVPTDKPVGAFIEGVDLSAPISGDVFHAIRQALDAHSVVVFRDQNVDCATHVRLSRQFGPLRVPRKNSTVFVPGWEDLTILSNILDDQGKPIGLIEAGQYWHSDNSFKSEPNFYALLYAEEIPSRDGKPLGGTQFASAVHAYDTLSKEMKERISGLQARNNFNSPYRKSALSGTASAVLWEETKEPDAIHPVVRTHPRTGRKCIYVNETYTVGMVGLEEQESRALVDELCRHMTRAEAVYTHHWKVGDFLIWDDCATQHNAVADYQLPQRRKLRRTTVAGAIPY